MRLTLLLTALSLAAFAPPPKPKHDHGKEDLKLIQGVWALDHTVKGGVRTPPEREAFWTIQGDTLTSTLYLRKGCRCRIVLDGRRTPRSIDLRHWGEDDEPMLGRYSVDGDTLRVSIGERRPRDLSGSGPSGCVWVFKRVSP
jgi:uncharacterized protein (TIGR03067 family)